MNIIDLSVPLNKQTSHYEGDPPNKIEPDLLASIVPVIENPTNLGALAGKVFDVYALPIPLEIDGAPGRVIAILKDNS